ncbi:MAG: carboxypeptidase regulatory-like domain-containing protein [Chloracidobacterium sp.]|nr:carboxypeptidase regulatory-like domain-containing protein [Chloracidobacterium sp.]
MNLKHFNLTYSRLPLALLWAIILLPCGAGLAHAQSNATDAAIEGYIRDASGGAVAGSNVLVKNTATNITSNTTSDAEGYYRFPLLQ